MFKNSFLLFAFSLLLLPIQADALDTIYVVRHAEKESGWPAVRETSSMHPLSAAGVARTERLAERLDDAGIAAIYTSQTTRTMHTGLALSRSREIPLVADMATVSESEIGPFLDGLRERHADDHAVLIVGHSNTVPMLLRALGVATECDEAMGISEHSYGPGIEGYEGLWSVNLSKPGCEGALRSVLP
jgi:broad specificity phosphatase PhoE